MPLLGGLVFILFFTHILAIETWRKPGCHRISHSRKVNIPGCVEFKIKTSACAGFCESWSLPSIMLGFKRHPVTSLGQCCNIMESEDPKNGHCCTKAYPVDFHDRFALQVPVKALCLDGDRQLVFKSAVSCACYHCQKD